MANKNYHPKYTFDNDVSIGRLANIFRSQNWIIPAYIQNRFTYALAKSIDEAEPEKRHEVLERGLEELYKPEQLAVMLIYRYKELPMIAPFSAIIGDAIEAFYSGLLHASILTLLPTIEGIIREFSTQIGATDENVRERLLHLIETFIDDDEKRSENYRNPELIIMAKTFWMFIHEDLFAKINNHKGIGKLNRHGILHGIFKDSDYAHRYNFYKLISLIDLLCFLSTPGSGISILAPDFTAKSMRLALYYRGLGGVCRIARQMVDLE